MNIITKFFKLITGAVAIEARAVVMKERDKDGCTALHIAAVEGDHGAVSDLLSNGADPNAQNGNGWTPLQVAKKAKKFPLIVEMLKVAADRRT